MSAPAATDPYAAFADPVTSSPASAAAPAAPANDPYAAFADSATAAQPSAPALDAAEFQRRVGRAPSSFELANFQANPGNWAPARGNNATSVAQNAYGIGENVAAAGSGALKAITHAVNDLLPGDGSAIEQEINTDPVLNFTPQTQAGKQLAAGIGTVARPIGAALGAVKQGISSVAGQRTADVAGDIATIVSAPGAAGDVTSIARSVPAAARGLVNSVDDSGEAAATATPLRAPGAPPPLTGAAATAQKTLDAAAAEKAAAENAGATANNAGSAAAAPQIASASPELQQAITVAVNKAGKAVDLDPINRHLEADSLPVKVQLTEGQATQDPTLISEEMNMRGQAPALADRFNAQNEALKDNLASIRDTVGPDVFSTDQVQHGDTLIQAYKDADATRAADIDAKYAALRDAAGGNFPVDSSTLLGNVRGALHKELLTDSAPPSVMRVLDAAAANGSLPYEQFEALRTNLATVQRTAQDGLARRAAGVIRNEMEQLPLQGGAAALKPLADAARSAARDRFNALEADPAYKAAVDSTVAPDDFVSRFVTGGKRDNVALMQQTLADNPVAQQTMGVAALDHLEQRAVGQSGNFSQAAYAKALNGLSPKLRSLVPAKAAEQLETLAGVARNVQSRPAGSSVNHSNSLVAALAGHASGVLEHGLNAAAHGVPVGSVSKAILKGKGLGSRVQRALAPGAGIGR